MGQYAPGALVAGRGAHDADVKAAQGPDWPTGAREDSRGGNTKKDHADMTWKGNRHRLAQVLEAFLPRWLNAEAYAQRGTRRP